MIEKMMEAENESWIYRFQETGTENLNRSKQYN